MENHEEYWDILDRDKRKTGKTIKKDGWLKDGEYHLSVLGAIRRPDGRFLITQRVLTKSWAPGWWEIPGGAAVAGETSRDAIVREIREETGLDVSGCGDGYVFSYTREDPAYGNNYFEDVYLFPMNFDLNDVCIQRSEAMDVRLASKEDIRALAEQGIFLHYDSIRQIFE